MQNQLKQVSPSLEILRYCLLTPLHLKPQVTDFRLGQTHLLVKADPVRIAVEVSACHGVRSGTRPLNGKDDCIPGGSYQVLNPRHFSGPEHSKVTGMEPRLAEHQNLLGGLVPGAFRTAQRNGTRSAERKENIRELAVAATW